MLCLMLTKSRHSLCVQMCITTITFRIAGIVYIGIIIDFILLMAIHIDKTVII